MNPRKNLRLPNYDYSTAGCYFITICTQNRQPLLSSIVGAGHLAGPMVQLTRFGEIVEQHIQGIVSSYPRVKVDQYAIMPNHIHLLLIVCPETGPARCPAPTGKTDIPKVIGALKSLTSRAAGLPLWQRSYYDHVIRDEADYLRIRNYIDTNPAKWAEDKYYIAQES